MTLLALQQQALLEALFDWPAQPASERVLRQARSMGSTPGRGLAAYQSNGHVLAERALLATYPVLAQLLGQASFADLARAFWHAQPPLRGDIARWGEGMCAFVQASAQLQDEPYLPDVARAEWLLHASTLAPDLADDLSTLALLTTEDAQTLALELAPGLSTLASRWPVASLLRAHREGTPSFAEVGVQLQERIAQDVVVWRAGYQPQLRQALPGERLLLQALQDGHALEPALSQATGMDFAQWLPLAVQTGLVRGACHHPRPH